MKNLLYLLLVSFVFINCDKKQQIKSITTLELKVLLAKDTIQLLDVRSPKEVKEGFIKTAFFANYFEDDFYTKASAQLNKKSPVYLYCKSGNRSGKSAVILQEKGFEVINVLGGYKQWKKEN